MSSQDPALLRRLLRAKDRMDAASEEDWPVERLADVSGVSKAHFARSFKEAFQHSAASLSADASYRARQGAAPRLGSADHRDCIPNRLEQPRHIRARFPRRYRREPERPASARTDERPRARTSTALLRQRCLQ